MQQTDKNLHNIADINLLNSGSVSFTDLPERELKREKMNDSICLINDWSKYAMTSRSTSSHLMNTPGGGTCGLGEFDLHDFSGANFQLFRQQYGTKRL